MLRGIKNTDLRLGWQGPQSRDDIRTPIRNGKVRG